VGASELLLTLRPGPGSSGEAQARHRQSLADRPARRMLGTRHHPGHGLDATGDDLSEEGPPALLPLAAPAAASASAAPRTAQKVPAATTTAGKVTEAAATAAPGAAADGEPGGYPSPNTGLKTGKKTSQPTQVSTAVAAQAGAQAAGPASNQSDALEVARGLLEARKELRMPLKADGIEKKRSEQEEAASAANIEELEASLLAADFGSDKANELAGVAERMGELQVPELFSNLPLVGDDNK